MDNIISWKLRKKCTLNQCNFAKVSRRLFKNPLLITICVFAAIGLFWYLMVTYPLELIVAIFGMAFGGVAFFTYWLAKEICSN